MEFPHMNDSEFPHIDSIDVYKYRNEFDYSRFDDLQMQVQVCCVPWDMGEAHIGARTISGIGNIVHFGSKEKRDKWFDSIPDNECFRWETKYKELHRDNEIVVPLPFDVASKYNYVVVSYNLFANDESLVEYEGTDGLRKWFWFIREVEFVAPNATKLHILNDAWQTFIYDVHITSMILERGHAPMFATSADDYLKAPSSKSTGLLEQDVISANPSYKRNTKEPFVFDDGEMYVVFLITSERNGWGEPHTQSWKTPAGHYNITDGTPNFAQIAVHVDDYKTFMLNIETEHENWKQTVQAVYLASSKLVNVGSPYEVAGVTAYAVNGRAARERLLTLDKSAFEYPIRYANIAKLYTYPYAYIETTDENGNTLEIRIEEMESNELFCGYAFNAIMGGLNLNACILGVGANPQTVTFKNLGNRSCVIGGRALTLQYDWNVPTFAIIQQASREYDFSGFFDRAQAGNDARTAYSNATASAATAKANADRSADTAKANADRSADTGKTNTTLETNKMNSNRALENDYRVDVNVAQMASVGEQYVNNVNKMELDRDEDNNFLVASTSATIQQAMGGSIVNAASGFTSSTVMGGVSGGLPGAAVGAVSGALGAIGSTASAFIAIDTTNSMFAASQDQLWNKTAIAIDNMRENLTSQTTASNKILNYDIDLNTDTTNNNRNCLNSQATNTQTMLKSNAAASQSTAKTNAAATQTTDNANATRTRDNALEAIDNTTRQKSLAAPYVYGSFSNTGNAATKPKMLVPYVVTQGKDAISYAGDEFLRYGYMYNRQWDFNTWHIGKHFTYWKLSDFWITGLNVPDMYMDKLRFFLYGGVTIWQKPEDIGNVSIYENGI